MHDSRATGFANSARRHEVMNQLAVTMEETMSTRNIPANLKRGQGGREASNPHHGLRQPADDQRVKQALDDVGLDDQGEVLEDQLRDRRSSGALRSKKADDSTSNERK